MKNIMSKLWIFIILLVVFILSSFWMFNIILLDKFYINGRVENLYEKAENIKNLIDDKVIDLEGHSLTYFSLQKNSTNNDLQNPDDLNHNPQMIPNRDDFFIYIKSDEIKSFINNPDQIKNNNRPIPFAFVLKDNTSILKKIDTNSKFDYIFNLKDKDDKKIFSILVGVPIQNKNISNGYLLFYNISKDLSQATKILKTQFSFIAFFSILISSFLAFLMARYFTKPILILNSATKQIAKGEYDLKIDIKNKDEIGMLANSINEMALELSQIENLRRDLIANISHELKTPISLIKAYSEMIIDVDKDNPSLVEEDSKIILNESDKLNSMVEDILYLSKIQSQRVELDIQTINLFDLFYCLSQKVDYFVKEKNINLSIKCSKDINILADYDKLFQALLNMIMNSINHTPSQKSIFLGASTEDNFIKVYVKDEGIGIPRDELNLIWERFYKVDKSRSPQNTGTGLGMSIIKSILTMHSFEFEIKSEPDIGTTISFYVPIK